MTKENVERELNTTTPTLDELTAAEAVVLIGQSRDASHPLKLALLELVAMGCLEVRNVEHRGLLGRRRHTRCIDPVPGAARPENPVLRQAFVAVAETPPLRTGSGQAGRPITSVARSTRERWGREGYATSVVEAALTARGLRSRVRTRTMGIPRTVIANTADGERIAGQLRDTLAKIERGEAPGAGQASVLLLLAADRRQRKTRDAGDGGAFFYWSADTGDERHQASVKDFDDISQAFDSISDGIDSGEGTVEVMAAMAVATDHPGPPDISGLSRVRLSADPGLA